MQEADFCEGKWFCGVNEESAKFCWKADWEEKKTLWFIYPLRWIVWWVRGAWNVCSGHVERVG